jgi:hypothetical protein
LCSLLRCSARGGRRAVPCGSAQAPSSRAAVSSSFPLKYRQAKIPAQPDAKGSSRLRCRISPLRRGFSFLPDRASARLQQDVNHVKAELLRISNSAAMRWRRHHASSLALRALYSNKTRRGKGGDGSLFVAHYSADGRGILIQGDRRTPRTWAIKGKDQVCVTHDSGTDCFTFERHRKNRNQIIGRHITQPWSFQATVEDGVPKF